MANRFKRKEVLNALFTMMSDIVEEVYTTERPNVKDTTQNWAVVSLPYGINAETSTLNYAFARIQLSVIHTMIKIYFAVAVITLRRETAAIIT